MPVAIAIAALLLVVVLSYRQVILAYPQGGGAYSVAKDNLLLQAATMLILVMAANTAFNDFPRLLALLARDDLLLYAIGVFIAFTISQSGMVLHWWRRRERGWRHAMSINALGALTTGVVAVIVASQKFMDGAWAVLIVIPPGLCEFQSIR